MRQITFKFVEAMVEAKKAETGREYRLPLVKSQLIIDRVFYTVFLFIPTLT